MTTETSRLIIDDAQLVQADGRTREGWVSIVDGLIEDQGPGAAPTRVSGRRLSLHGALLGPGFIDLHIHGIAGVDFMTATPAEWEVAAKALARHGITGFLAGTYTKTFPEILAALQATAQQLKNPRAAGAQLLGSYVEGPFFSEARRGAHPAELLRRPDKQELGEVLAIPGVRVLSHAPELAGSDDVIDALISADVVSAIGHSDATWQVAHRAIERGARLATHLFDGMRGLHHRELGIAGACLLDDRVVCELIADGLHVHPDMLDLAYRVKGLDGLALVSDGGAATDLDRLPEEMFARGYSMVDGLVRDPEGSISSSTTMLDRALLVFAQAADISLARAWGCVSTVPARVLGLEHYRGQVKQEFIADLTAMTDTGEVILTVCAGRITFAKLDSLRI